LPGVRFLPRESSAQLSKSLIFLRSLAKPDGPAFAPVGADHFVLVRNTVPRVAPIAPAEIRQTAPAPQRNAGGDPFSQLLNATAGDDHGNDTLPPSKDEPAPEPRHAGRAPVSRASHRHEADRSDRQDAAKSDAPPSDKTDETPPQKNTAGAGDGAGKQDGDAKQSKKDKKASADGTTTAAAILPAADTVTQATLNVNLDVTTAVVAAPPAVAAAADSDTAASAPAADAAPVGAVAAADTPAVPPVADLLGDVPVATDKTTADKTVAQTSTAGGLVMSAAKAAAGAKVVITGKADETTGKDAKTDPAAVAPDAPDSKTAAKPTTAAAGAMIAAKLVSSVLTQQGNAAPGQNDNGAAGPANPVIDPKAGIAANAVAGSGAMADAAKAANRESIETILSQHVSADTQPSNTGQIVLPDASRSFASTLNTVGTQIHLQSAANNAPPIPLASAAIAIEIAARSRDGSNQFQIRLDPPELGRIDVKLDVDKSGQVNTHLTVDRPETLDLLQRDARGLERALQQAGLKTGDNGLAFSLRQQTPDGFQNGRQQGQHNTPAAIASIDEGARAAASVERHQWTASLRGGVDIRV
jgi:flagellar hook-length control protein FliK